MNHSLPAEAAANGQVFTPCAVDESGESAGFVAIPTPPPETHVAGDAAEHALEVFKDRMWREGEIPAMHAAIQSTWPEPHLLHIAVAAVLEADTEFRSNLPKGWEGDPLSDEIDGLRRIFEAAPAPQDHLMGDDEFRDALKTTANQMLQKTGWKPGDNFSFHSVSELMTALAFTQVKELAVKNERLRKMLAGCDWYWPEDDTSSDACADGPWQIVENCDVKPGEVFGYSRGGIVETRYYGFLEPAEDADSDDEFEADEPTREGAEAKIAAELQRRATRATTADEPCEYCGPGKHTGLPGGACENCMNTGLKYPSPETREVGADE